MQLRSLILVIACCGITYSCFSQSLSAAKTAPPEKTIYITKYDSNPPPLNFRSFDLKDGLPRGEVNEFIQTDDGFVWFSLSELGLVRFDGYHFRVFNSFSEDTTSLPNEHITSMAKSHKNGLWLASTRGIIWFDLTTYKSKLIPLPAGMSSLYYRLFEDSHQRLWLYYSENLFLYESLHNKFTELKSHGATDAFNGEKVNIDKTTIFDINESENGDLFLLGNCLLKLNPETFAFIYYKITNTHSPFFTFAIDQDKKNIWLSGWDGLLKLNYKSDSLTHYTFEKINTQPGIENHSFVSQKNDSQLWLSNEQEIRIFNKNTNKVSAYKKANNENISVTEFNAKGINGIEWFWSYKIGFTGLFPSINRFSYHKFLPGNNRSLCQWHDVKNNIIWFGSEDRNNVAHAYKYDAASNKLLEIKLPVKGMGSPRFIMPFSKGNCLIAIAGVNPIARRGLTFGKMFLLNTTTNTITQIKMPIDNHIGFTTDSLIYQNGFSDKDGDYWITTEGQGLIHYNNQTQQFFQYASDAKDSNTLSSNYLYSVACGADNTVWAGSMYDKDNVYNKSDNVLNKLDVTTGKVHRIPLFSKDESVKPLCEDKKGNVWIDTPSGLVCYNRYSGKKYKVPNFKHIFNQAYVDSKGNIILLARDGLWFYDPVKETSRLFNEEDGIRLEYFEGDFLDKRIYLFNDSIFISDSYRFPVSDLYPKKEIPPLHFTSIKIFGKELAITKNVDALDTLILRHNENQISFEFASLSFLSPERNTYACMLSGDR